MCYAMLRTKNRQGVNEAGYRKTAAASEESVFIAFNVLASHTSIRASEI